MLTENFLPAIGLTIFAGLATGIGSLIAFSVKKTNYRFLSIATGFSAGVMLYVSFIEIFFKGSVALVAAYGDPLGHWVNVGSFFGGMLVIGIIDAILPSIDNPHETHTETEMEPLKHKNISHPQKLIRMGTFTAIAIAIHNFPEGAATFLAALKDPTTALAIAIAIALHNIPEGISVSVPIYYATGSRRKALWLSIMSGLAEPVGALIVYALLIIFASSGSGVIAPQVMGIMFGGVAGIMVYISIDQLLPASRAYSKGHDSIIALISGMLVMALSLLLMK